ncbi:hypothetical protein, partial [Propionivibrio sp.]|uniref:hypothetical protein n=1 Tax=Propionivibrio sp. TaxID=2212460 RepID=UPI003BF0648D
MKHCKVLCRDETQHGEDYYLASQADSIIERLTEVAATTDLILKAVNETVERLTAERDALNDTVVRLTADAGIFTLD